MSLRPSLPTVPAVPATALLRISLCALLCAPAALAQNCPNDDAFEPNNNIAEATPSGATPAGVRFDNLTVLPTSSGNGQFDEFSVQLEPGESLFARAEFSASATTLGMQIIDGNNAVLLTEFSGSGSSEEILFTNTTGQGNTFYLDVQNTSPSACVDYNLLIRRTFCPSDDNLENFDDCESSAGFPGNSGTIPSLAVLANDKDFIGLPLLPGETLMVRVDFEHDLGDIDLRLYDETLGSCGAAIAASDSTTDMEMITYTNSSTGFRAIVVEVFLFSGICNGYSITWDVTPAEPCFSPDMFENNDDICSSALAPTVGIYDGLTIADNDPDFMDLGTVSPGSRYTVAVDFDHSQGDIDLRLWDVTAGCSNAVLIETSDSVLDFEEISFVNSTAGSIALVAEIYLFSTGCNTYSWTESAGAMNGIGDLFCGGTFNSTGQTGITFLEGNVDASLNDATLRGRRLPVNQFGLFVTSLTPGSTPNLGGGQGRLCLGGAIGRFQGPGQIVQANAAGEVSLPINLNTLPQGSGSVAAQAGETWYFQYWHRDVVGGAATSNLASGMRIRFQ